MTQYDANHEVEVSIVIPVYNEEASLRPLRDELLPVLEGLGKTFEIVFVDDGSTDGSAAILREFFETDKRVRVIRFARNFGQQMANTAGLRFTHGRAVIIMDADLQTPAAHIPEFLEKLAQGYDIVYGVRPHTIGPLYRRVGSYLADRLIRRVTGFNIPDSVSGYVALDEQLVRKVNRYNDKSRYLSGLFAWLSYGRWAAIPISRRERSTGESKYTIWQLMRLVLNFITSFSTRPLHIASLAGLGTLGMAGLVGLGWLYRLATAGWAQAETVLLAFALFVVGGVQLLAMGVLGEYIGRIYGEVRERPPYLIADVLDRTNGPGNADAHQ